MPDLNDSKDSSKLNGKKPVILTFSVQNDCNEKIKTGILHDSYFRSYVDSL